MFERLDVSSGGCSHDSILSDRFHIQRILMDFSREASIHLDDDQTEKLLIRLSKIYSELSTSLDAAEIDGGLVKTWGALNAYLRLEMCGGCLGHFILAFQMISGLLTENPNCVYLLFCPVSEASDLCPVHYLCMMLRKALFGRDLDAPDFKYLLSCMHFLQAEFVGDGIRDEFIRSLETGCKDDPVSTEASGTAERRPCLEELGVQLLIHSLEALEVILKCIDDLAFMYETDFKQTDSFSLCTRAILDTFLPVFQVVLSSKLMQKLHGKETDSIKEIRIMVLRILERLALVLSSTDLFPFLLELLNKGAVSSQGTVFESLMDIFSPDFPNWYTSRYRGLAELKNFIFILQLQFTGFLFVKNLCNSLSSSSSVSDLFLSVRRHYIPFDELPDFISKNSYWFSDVKDKLNFDRENSSFGNTSEFGSSLPQHVNSIFSNLFYRIAAVAFHNGLKLEQNMIDFSKITETMHKSIIGSETLALKRLHSLKIDIFTVNIQIISFILASIVSISDKETSDEEFRKSNPTAEVISILHLFLVWICEFVFDYKSKIPRLYQILEEINLIKIRLPILYNSFNSLDHSPRAMQDKTGASSK
ncbi:putative transmembrane domain-containing protein [Cryptosporidium canis]|nr:putative transmembrane domain-containing protein [Cryptosporidium canis]